jgi:hypothetical protein
LITLQLSQTAYLQKKHLHKPLQPPTYVGRFTFGQWPDNNNKHNMAEAASEFATEVVTMASELKAQNEEAFKSSPSSST